MDKGGGQSVVCSWAGGVDALSHLCAAMQHAAWWALRHGGVAVIIEHCTWIRFITLDKFVTLGYASLHLILATPPRFITLAHKAEGANHQEDYTSDKESGRCGLIVRPGACVACIRVFIKVACFH